MGCIGTAQGLARVGPGVKADRHMGHKSQRLPLTGAKEMQLTDEIQNAVSTRTKSGRGRLPFLLIGGVLFLFVLSACQVAVGDDGTINIRPESTEAAPANNGNIGAAPGAAAGQGGSGNTHTGFASQTGEVDPASTSPIDPDQLYEWNGVIEWIDANTAAGGHFIIDRGCDRWSVIAENDELFVKLKELNGEKGVIWGTVSFNNVFGHRAIEASSVFAPGDIRPLIALPQIPCNDTPVPGPHIAVNHSEVTLHGDLVWRAGGLWLVTPRGNVRLELQDIAFEMFPELEDLVPAASDIAEDIDLSFSLGEYGVVGMWDLGSTGLVVKVRDIKQWPHRTFVRNHCGGGAHHFVVGDSQLAAHGTLVITDGQWILRTKSGVIFIHRNDNSALVDPATGDVTDVRPDILRTHDVVVIGDWKTDGSELHMEADRFVRVKTNCEPPKPPRQPILPGEIAALGTLVFENGRPFLNTPSGRIVLFRQSDVPDSEPQPVDPSFFEDIAPEVTDAAGVVIGEDGTVQVDPNRPDIVRPVRHILVVGKWMLYRDHLAIVVRYALPWPYPSAQPIDPVPAAPQPVPPIFEFPLPLPEPQSVPGVLGFPVEPTEPDWPEIDVERPDFEGWDDDVYEKPSFDDTTTKNGVSAGSFSAASVK